MEEIGSVAMPETKRLAGVTPEVNCRECVPEGGAIAQCNCSVVFQISSISGNITPVFRTAGLGSAH